MEEKQDINRDEPNHRYQNKYALLYRTRLDELPVDYYPFKLVKEYLLSRVFPMMAYYNKSATKNKKDYYLFSILSVVFNSLIPVFVLLGDDLGLTSSIKIMITALSCFSGILMMFNFLNRPREKWIMYEYRLERLRIIVNMLFMGVGEFECEREIYHKVLFDSVESVVNEDADWRDLLNRKTRSE